MFPSEQKINLTGIKTQYKLAAKQSNNTLILMQFLNFTQVHFNDSYISHLITSYAVSTPHLCFPIL